MEIDWSRARPCKFCRAKIVDVPGPNGKKIPVQKVTQLYLEPTPGMAHVAEQALPEHLVPASGVVDEHLIMRKKAVMWVSHFQTCPDASKASKKGKKS